MRVTRHVYEVEGWGVGEVWARGGEVVQHELASPGLELLPSRDAGPAARHEAAADDAATGRAARRSAGDGPAPRSGGVGPPTGTLSTDLTRNRADIVPELCRRFTHHLRGEPVGYDDVTLDATAWATPFQHALADALRAVPWGEVVSYGELAALAGRPGAARAAGTFCAENRFALIVPCHRVVAADGIGGYGTSGVAVKRRLLALEGVDL